MADELGELQQKYRKLENQKSGLERAFTHLQDAVASTLRGAKKVTQTAFIVLAWRWFGLWIALGVLGFLLVVELIEQGHVKVLAAKPAEWV